MGKALLAAALPLLALLSGCASQGQAQATVRLANETGQEVEVLVKAWDHNGALVLDRTFQVAAMSAPSDVGQVAGPVSNYGGRYSWFAQSGALTHQEERGPEGVTAWTVTVKADRIAFTFS